jgi:hypothetical protein
MPPCGTPDLRGVDDERGYSTYDDQMFDLANATSGFSRWKITAPASTSPRSWQWPATGG